MRRRIPVLLLCYWLLAAFAGNKPFPKVPENWPKPVYAISSIETNKVLLGRALFYDPILSADQTISCASCHSPYNAFAHTDHALSHGIHDSIGTRNAPALMNLAWQSSFMWDGSVPHLDMQALFPITHPAEMGETMAHVILKLRQSAGYKKLYGDAFNDTLITGEHTLKAISAFMVTLVSCNSKYDSVMRQESVFTKQEKSGYKLFRKNCSACHTEPLFTNLQFENNGLPVNALLQDAGRMKVTNDAKDSLCFKVPTLRNIEFTYPYMHDGRFKKLSEVLRHYTEGIQQSTTLSEHLKKPVQLTPDEKVDLTAFLLTLTDKSFLFNPENAYPKALMEQIAGK